MTFVSTQKIIFYKIIALQGSVLTDVMTRFVSKAADLGVADAANVRQQIETYLTLTETNPSRYGRLSVEYRFLAPEPLPTADDAQGDQIKTAFLIAIQLHLVRNF